VESLHPSSAGSPIVTNDQTARQGRPLRSIGLLTPSGWGNLGDAAIQDAVIQAIRRRHPRARIEAFTLNPADTRRRHGIEADVLSGFGVTPGYRVQPAGEESTAAASSSSSARHASTSGTTRRSGRLRRTVATLDGVLYRVLCDLRYLRRLRGKLRDLDAVVASGGGQVDAEWGGAFGHPFTLAKWSLLCRMSGVPFSLLAVGVHHLDSTLSRLFARIALHNAHRVTFRDEVSRRMARRLHLVEDAPVVPDLAFAHERLDPALWEEGEAGAVAVGPISWCDPRVWPRRDRARYLGYLRRLAAFVGSVLAEGRRVVLVPGDTSDAWAAGDLEGILREELPPGVAPESLDRLEIPRIESVQQLLDALRGVELVVTSRLHGVLLAAALGKPVLAVVYDRKVDTLARDLALGDYLVDIERFDVVSLRSNFERLAADAPRIREKLRPIVSGYRERLERLFEEVL